jgi:hypothetical protein
MTASDESCTYTTPEKHLNGLSDGCKVADNAMQQPIGAAGHKPA